MGKKIEAGDTVQKVRGYPWPGVVVSAFRTLAGRPRFVVECTVPEVAGALHIYLEDQLVVTTPKPIIGGDVFVEGRWLKGDEVTAVAIVAGVSEDVVRLVLDALGEVRS